MTIATAVPAAENARPARDDVQRRHGTRGWADRRPPGFLEAVAPGAATSEWCTTWVRLRSGDRVVVRSQRRDDEAGLRTMFDELSNSSRYQRFLAGKPTVSRRCPAPLVDVDHRDHEWTRRSS